MSRPCSYRGNFNVAEFFAAYSSAARGKNPVMNEAIPAWGRAALSAWFFSPENCALHDVIHTSINLQRGPQREFEKLKSAMSTAEQTGKRLIIGGSIDGGYPYLHAVSLQFDPRNKSLLYQDPYGRSMPEHLQKFFAENYESLAIENPLLPQQKDDLSCAYIAFYNEVCMALETPMAEEIDIKTLRRTLHQILEERSHAEALSYSEQSQTAQFNAQPAAPSKFRFVIKEVTDPPRADFIASRVAVLWQPETSQP